MLITNSKLFNQKNILEKRNSIENELSKINCDEDEIMKIVDEAKLF